jgi:hypothetical protein
MDRKTTRSPPSFPPTALGRADAAGLLRAFGDALPQPQHDRLAALMDAARVMPEETFVSLRSMAASAATATDAGETKVALEKTTSALSRVATMDERTASVVQLFFEDDETSDVEQTLTELDKNKKLAVGVTRLMDALRRFPNWTDADAAAFERAVVAARAETWRRFDDAFRFANLGDAAVTKNKRPDDGLRVVTGKGEQKTTQPLLGVAASRVTRSGPPAPFSSLAAAPGLATASALGSARRSFEGDGDGDGDGDETKTKTKTSDAAWGVGARSDAAATRALRDAFDPESIGLPRAFRRARGVSSMRVAHRFGARPGQVRELLGRGGDGGDERSAVRRERRRAERRAVAAVRAVVLRRRLRVRRGGRVSDVSRVSSERRAVRGDGDRDGRR